MAYTDDAVKAKLSSLNETQESIVSVAQWIMFHRRHADRTCAIWLERMRETTVNKRLTLIYLANEVVQQSKARKKDDFLVAFSPVIAEASATAYKGATNDVQEKIKRTVEVWNQRRIFDKPIQEAVEARILELEKSRSGKKTGLLGGSLFSSGSSTAPPPAELQPLIPLQAATSKASAISGPAVSSANAEYDKLANADKPTPSPPVYAARLSALLKSLSSAETAVAESIKTRQDLINGLEDLLATSRASLKTDQSQLTTTTHRRELIEKQKRAVEDAIMSGQSGTESPSMATGGTPQSNGRSMSSAEPERPQVEALTPPPTESLTPKHSPRFTPNPILPTNIDVPTEHHNQVLQHPPSGPSPHPTSSPPVYLENLPPPQTTPSDPRYSASSSSDPRYGTFSPTKKRKLDAEFEGFGAGEDAMAGLDDDVAELLRAESGGVA
ncbi:MAG: hypothetical protein LQ337_004964 [Flavoplaca oasis]|nr:MAG: hypothetical protein LQ337_004964 [Flavoplaca oasis]